MSDARQSATGKSRQHASADAPPSLEDQRRYYNDRWASQDYVGKGALLRAAEVLAMIGRLGLKAPRILDFGCGTGWLSSIASTVGPTTALDLSDKAIERAKFRWPWIEFHALDAAEADFPEASFDILVSHEVIEHIENQAEYLDRAARFLAPGRYLILTTPNARAFESLPQKAKLHRKDQPIENRLTKSELRRLLRRGFTILRWTSTGFYAPRMGVYRCINHRYLRSLFKALRLLEVWEKFWADQGFGLHFVVLARKKSAVPKNPES